MLRARVAFPLVAVVVALFASFISVSTAHAAFCLPKSALDNMQGANTTGMSVQTVGGQQMYCNLDPSAGQPPTADFTQNACSLYCPPPSTMGPGCSCSNPSPMADPICPTGKTFQCVGDVCMCTAAPAPPACQAGQHPAAANEVPGVPAGTCVDQKSENLLFGGCPTNPYPILEQFRGSSNAQITPSSNYASTNPVIAQLQNGINPILACRLSKFLQYAQQSQGCTFKINSAYRSAAEQQAICGGGGPNCGTPGYSCHQYGLAVDLTSSSQCMSWAKTFLGSKNPSSPGAQMFQLHWPIPSDDGHTQCIENMVGNCNPSTQGCGGSISITPDLRTPPMQPQSPFSPFGAFGSLGGMTPPTQRPLMPQQPILPPTPVSPQTNQNGSVTQCTPSFSCVGNQYIYQSSTCQQQVLKTCASGCDPAGNVCARSSSATSSMYISGSSNGGSTDASLINIDAGPSAFDQISQIANPFSNSAAVIGTPIDIALNDALNNVVESSDQTPTSTEQGTTYASGTVATNQGSSPQNTFVSEDLAYSPSSYTPQQDTFSERMIALLQEALQWAQSVLQPYGRPGIQQAEIHYMD